VKEEHFTKTQTQNKFILNIVIALHPEAKPLIEYYHLRKITHIDMPFTIYVNKEKTIYLIISGIGKIKIATATTFLYMWTGSKSHSTFLNIGLAGSKQFALEEGVLIHKITEMSTHKNGYPFVTPIKIKNQATLMTYDTPQKDYPMTGLMDMEGSAFFQTATHFVSVEQVQLFKVVSDADEKSLLAINHDQASQWINKNLKQIALLADYLISLSSQENQINMDDDLLEKFKTQWHFTYSQLLQLKKNLRHWRLHNRNLDVLDYCKHEKTAAHVNFKLVKILNENCVY